MDTMRITFLKYFALPITVVVLVSLALLGVFVSISTFIFVLLGVLIASKIYEYIHVERSKSPPLLTTEREDIPINIMPTAKEGVKMTVRNGDNAIEIVVNR
jgi:hypothetical protein